METTERSYHHTENESLDTLVATHFQSTVHNFIKESMQKTKMKSGRELISNKNASLYAQTMAQKY
jgi:hypothetical protein